MNGNINNKVRKMLAMSAFATLTAFVAQADELPVLAFWQFNASDPYADSSGSGNTINNHTRQVDCGGNYARFDYGTSGYFGRNSLNLSSYSSLTVEMFIRLDTYRAGQMIFFTHYGWNGTGTGFFAMHGGVDDNGDVGQCVATWLKTKSDTVTTAREVEKSDTAALSDMKWHHVALVMDASSDDEGVVDEMKLYIDGVLQTTSTGNGHHTRLFNSTAFMLGSCGEGNSQYYRSSFCSRAIDFIGDIDDVRITAAALTPEQFLSAPTVVDTASPEGAVEWRGGAAPTAGADVHVPGDATIELSGETPVFGSITVDGTILFTTSNNCLRAGSVRVGKGGRLQAGPPFGGSSAVSNRVWVVCDTFTLDKGGRINAIGAGFWGGTAAHSAAGPGAGSNAQDTRAIAGSHGGFNTTSPMGKAAYGSAEWPETAGSGGWRSTEDMAGSNGGGVVRIDATGVVTIDGEICADSPDMVQSVNYGRSAPGAGGSILVTCSHIAGAGKMSARGGHSSGAERASDSSNRKSSPGAGGRIAVHYDPQVQTYAEASGLVFEVQAGKSRPYGYSFPETGFWMYAGAGTLWFPDETLIGAANLSNFRGRLVNADELAFDGDVVVSNWVGFATDGVRISVNGNLTVTGSDGRLEIGGVRQVSNDSNLQRKSYVSERASLLQVSGSLVVTNSARFDLYAAATNAGQVVGATVNVGGRFSVATNCFVYPFTHPQNGGAPLFTMNDFEVDLGGVFGIAGGGYSGRKGANGCGPGYGSASIGAGHGGLGGRVRVWDGDVATTNSTTFGKVYDDELRPALAGSGGGHNWDGQNGGGIGGGVLHVVASNSISIAGALMADGTAPNTYNNGSTGGAGGSILLETKAISIAPTARITAKGGDSSTSNLNEGKYTAGGGGGRIAVWSGEAVYEPTWRRSRYEVLEETPAEWADVFDVSGGAALRDTAAYAGEDGTLRIVRTFGTKGIVISFR